MNYFLKKIVGFTILLLAFLLVFQFAVDEGLRNNYTSFFYVWNNVYQGKIKADIIIFGSSRAKKHFAVPEMEKELNCSVFNMGMDGANVYLQQTIWNAYLNNNPKPKLIILELEEVRLEKDKSLFNKEQFLPYIFKKEIFNAIRPIQGFSYADVSIPFYKYHDYGEIVSKGLTSLIKPQNDSLEEFNKGYEPLSGELKDSVFYKKKIILDITEVKNTLGLLNKLYAKLKIEGVKLLIVKTPKYKAGGAVISNEEEIKMLLNKFILDNNIPYLDYSNKELMDKPSLFFDVEHLNGTGANVFTKMFCNDLKTLKLF